MVCVSGSGLSALPREASLFVRCPQCLRGYIIACRQAHRHYPDRTPGYHFRTVRVFTIRKWRQIVGKLVQRVPSRYYAVLGQLLHAQPREYERLLANSNVDVQALEDPDGTLTIAELESLVDVASRITGRTDLGFEVGRRVRLNSHGPLGYALLSSRTIDQVLRLTMRYYHLIVPVFTLRYERSRNSGEVTFTPCAVMQQRTLQFFLEAIAVSFHVQAQMILGQDNEGYDIYLSMEPPPHVNRYLSSTPARFHFGERRVVGVTVNSASSLQKKPLPMADESVVRRI